MWTRVSQRDNSQSQRAVTVQSGDDAGHDGGSVGGAGPADTDDVVQTTTPRVLGDYTLRKVLGRGGMGMVWLATRRARGVDDVEHPCVVKTLRSSDDPEYERRFIDEARLLVLVAHKNICSVFDAGCVEGQYYLAMEHIDGHDLKKIAALTEQTGAPLPTGVIVHVVTQVLEALDAAHRMRHPTTKEPLKVVHRDVSPQNVMLAHDGRVKLIDFGLALSTQKVEKTAPSVVMGKLAYMAPEQARGEPIDGRADQFAAGILLYEMLANARYYEGLSVDDTWRKSGAGGHMPQRLAELPEGLRAIVLKATSTRAASRYPSCAAMAEALVHWARDHDEPAGPADARVALRELLARTNFLEAATGERPRMTSLAGRNAVAFGGADDAVDEPPAPREKTRTFRLSDLDATVDGNSDSADVHAHVELLDDPAGPTTRTTPAPASGVARAEPTLLVRLPRDATPMTSGAGDDEPRRRRRVTAGAIAAGLAIAVVVAVVVVARERAASTVAAVVDTGSAPVAGVVDAGLASLSVDGGVAPNLVDAGTTAPTTAPMTSPATGPTPTAGPAKPRGAARPLPPWPAGPALRQAGVLREHCADVACTRTVLENFARTDGPARDKLERQLRACYATCRQTPR
jgi:serine/threonine protein kinase